MTEVEEQYLPPRVLEIAEIIGLDGALILVSNWGGLRLYVPEPDHVHEDHPLAQRLGVQRAKNFCANYAREKIDVPRCLSHLRRAFEQRIAADNAAGVSVRELAMRHGLTERAVWMALARYRTRTPPNQDQQDLFDQA